MKRYIPVAVVALTFVLTPDLKSQSIILVNGEPTEVVLDGDAIKSIVKNKIDDYMKEYGQEVDTNFKKSDLRFEDENNQSRPSDGHSHSHKNEGVRDYVLSTDRPKDINKFK